MAYKISFRTNNRLQKLLQDAPAFALQRTARDCLRAAKKKIAEIYTIRRDVIGKYLSISRVEPKERSVYLIGSRKEKRGNVQLSYFEIARQQIVSGRTRRITKRTRIKATTKRERVLAKIKRSSGYKPIKSAFAVRLGTGHIAILRRKTEERYPLQTLYGIGVPYMLRNPEVFGAIRNTAVESFHRHLRFALVNKE